MRIDWSIRLKSLNQSLRLAGAVAYSSIRRERERATVLVANEIQRGGPPPGPPFLVTMTRFGKRELDDDNLAGAFKHIRDGIATALGVDDNDRANVSWVVRQEKSTEYSVRIEINARR